MIYLLGTPSTIYESLFHESRYLSSHAFILCGVIFRLSLSLSLLRAQAAGGQEFADFGTELGVGTYKDQARPLNLPDIDEDLSGFEGAIAANSTATFIGYGGWISSPDVGVLDMYHSILHIKSTTSGLGLSVGMMISGTGINQYTKIIGK